MRIGGKTHTISGLHVCDRHFKDYLEEYGVNCTRCNDRGLNSDYTRCTEWCCFTWLCGKHGGSGNKLRSGFKACVINNTSGRAGFKGLLWEKKIESGNLVKGEKVTVCVFRERGNKVRVKNSRGTKMWVESSYLSGKYICRKH